MIDHLTKHISQETQNENMIHAALFITTPITIEDLSIIDEENWHYKDYNRIKFKNGLVSGWNNSNGKLKVRMGLE